MPPFKVHVDFEILKVHQFCNSKTRDWNSRLVIKTQFSWCLTELSHCKSFLQFYHPYCVHIYKHCLLLTVSKRLTGQTGKSFNIYFGGPEILLKIILLKRLCFNNQPYTVSVLSKVYSREITYFALRPV